VPGELLARYSRPQLDLQPAFPNEKKYAAAPRDGCPRPDCPDPWRELGLAVRKGRRKGGGHAGRRDQAFPPETWALSCASKTRMRSEKIGQRVRWAKECRDCRVDAQEGQEKSTQKKRNCAGQFPRESIPPNCGRHAKKRAQSFFLGVGT